MLADVYVTDVDEDRAAIGHEADDHLSNRCGIEASSVKSIDMLERIIEIINK